MPFSKPTRFSRRSRRRGFTLLEVLVVLAITGMLAAFAVPGMMDMVSRMSVNGAAKSAGSALSMARSEAIKRGVNVSICASADGADCDAGAWSSGWVVFIDANGDADGDTGSIDAGDTVLQVYEPLNDVVLTSTDDLLSYNNRGFGLNGGVVTLKACPEDNNPDNALAIEVSVSGRGRVIDGGLVCP